MRSSMEWSHTASQYPCIRSISNDFLNKNNGGREGFFFRSQRCLEIFIRYEPVQYRSMKNPNQIRPYSYTSFLRPMFYARYFISLPIPSFTHRMSLENRTAGGDGEKTLTQTFTSHKPRIVMHARTTGPHQDGKPRHRSMTERQEGDSVSTSRFGREKTISQLDKLWLIWARTFPRLPVKTWRY